MKLTIKCDSTEDVIVRRKQMYSYVTEKIDGLGFHIHFTVHDTEEYDNIYIKFHVANGLELDVARHIRNSIKDEYLTTNNKGYFIFK